MQTDPQGAGTIACLFPSLAWRHAERERERSGGSAEPLRVCWKPVQTLAWRAPGFAQALEKPSGTQIEYAFTHEQDDKMRKRPRIAGGPGYLGMTQEVGPYGRMRVTAGKELQFAGLSVVGGDC